MCNLRRSHRLEQNQQEPNSTHTTGIFLFIQQRFLFSQKLSLRLRVRSIHKFVQVNGLDRVLEEKIFGRTVRNAADVTENTDKTQHSSAGWLFSAVQFWIGFKFVRFRR